MAEQQFKSIGLVGLGLIGGSFALAAKTCWPGIEIQAYDPSDAAQQWARANGSITLHRTIEELAAASQLIVIAAPLQQFESIMGVLGTTLGQAPGGVSGNGTIIIDLASTKVSALRCAQQSLGAWLPRFVACHPIAGSEQSGARHARADLFSDKPVVLTPHPDIDPHALQLVKDMWQALGARIVTMAANQHDELFAYLSHAPHLLAFIYMLAGGTVSAQQMALAGNGFRDFTRIAASSPELWTDILLDNRAAVIKLLEHQRQAIAHMSELLSNQQRQPLLEILTTARELRASLA